MYSSKAIINIINWLNVFWPFIKTYKELKLSPGSIGELSLWKIPSIGLGVLSLLSVTAKQCYQMLYL